MKALDFANAFRRGNRPWFEIFRLDVTRESIAKWLAVDPYVAWRDGLGNADYFAVEFSCGLALAFECPHQDNYSRVISIEPVPQHTRRHLSLWEPQLENVFNSDGPTFDRSAILDQFGNKMPHLLESDCYQLMRQGDDGNPFPIGEPTSKLDASCWIAELEARGHKQTYWIVKS